MSASSSVGRRGAHGHARAVVEHDVERFDVVNDFAAEQAVDAATVVADHAAEGAAGVSGGIGRVGEVMEFGGVAQAVENDAGLDARQLLRGVESMERIHVARIVEDHGHVDALAGEAGARAAGQHGGAGGAAGGQCGFNVGGVAREDDADGKLAVVRGVGGVESARAEIEADKIGGIRAAKRFFEEGFELAMRREALMVERRRDWRGWKTKKRSRWNGSALGAETVS